MVHEPTHVQDSIAVTLTTPQPLRAVDAMARPVDPTVFLSYAHAEQTTALALRDALATRGLYVLIDVDHLNPGADIAEFARRSIRRADATICLASSASLSSAWVVFEAVSAIANEFDNPSGRLIACATDGAFLDHGFDLTLAADFQQRLERLTKVIGECLEKDVDITSLAEEQSRLRRMRSMLGDVLGRLRTGYTLLFDAGDVAQAATAIADHVRALRGLAPSRHDPRDIQARAEQLRRFLWDEQTDAARVQLLDFVREFSDTPQHVREAIVLSNTLLRIARLERDKGVSFADAEAQRQPAIYKVLELIDEIEMHPRLPVAS